MFLEKILAYKRLEVAKRKELIPLSSDMIDMGSGHSRGFAESLKSKKMGIIAEVKKASPSKGLLCPNFDPVKLGEIYEAAEAAAISVLTDAEFFQGSLEYLKEVKKTTLKTSILRKDFIIDSYQLLEAKLAGADAVLLIVAALTKAELATLLVEAQELGLGTLVEVHNREELLTALGVGATVIGINNRDLKTFQVSLETSLELAPLVPAELVLVSESGIQKREDVELLEQAGFRGILVGEALVTAANPAAKIKELMGVSG